MRWYSFDDETLFPGAKAISYRLYVYSLVFFFFETLKKCSIIYYSFVLTRYKTVLKSMLPQSSFSEESGKLASGL